MFTDSQKVSQHLCGMIFVCQAVPHRNTCVFCQLLHNFLPEAAVFNPVIDPSQNPGCIPGTFFFTDLGTFGIQICGPHTQIMSCHLKGAAGPGAGLFKNKRYISALQSIYGNTLFFLFFQFSSQINEIFNFLCRKIFQCQKTASF